MDSLERIRTLFPIIDRIYPGHGPDLTQGSQVVSQYIQHRKDREAQILGVLGTAGAVGISSMGIVETVYKDYHSSIWPAANSRYIFFDACPLLLLTF
jgi:endoribonuclease LACTB2